MVALKELCRYLTLFELSLVILALLYILIIPEQILEWLGGLLKTVEDLDGVSLLADTLPLLCRDVELLCLKNGRLCVLQICLDEKYNKPGKKLYVLASVFSLVEKRMDKVSRREVVPWPPHMYTPDETHWTSEEVGEIKVFGSIELRSSLFAVDEEGSGEDYYLLGCFPASGIPYSVHFTFLFFILQCLLEAQSI